MPAKKGSIPWNKGKIGVQAPPPHKFDDSLVFTENSKIARHHVKNRIIKRKLLEYKCACCGIEAIWNNKPMPLILDHINGINDDNRLQNLRFVCSNCDSQLDTYKSRNIKKKKGVVAESGLLQLT